LQVCTFCFFSQENPLVQKFKKICDVDIWHIDPGLVFVRDFPALHKFLLKTDSIINIALFCQKVFNFFGSYLPNRIENNFKKIEDGYEVLLEKG
jgi:hypothetical protein